MGMIVSEWNKKWAKKFDENYPWFVYSGPVTEEAIIVGWKARMPGGKPAPHAEVYQKYAVERFAVETLGMVIQAGGEMPWGQIDGMSLFNAGSELQLRLHGQVVYKFWYNESDAAKGIKHGDMGDFPLFRFAYMVEQIALHSWLLTEQDIAADATTEAKKVIKEYEDKFAATALGFTDKTGFLPGDSILLRPKFSPDGNVVLGFDALLEPDYSRQYAKVQSIPGYVGYYHTK